MDAAATKTSHDLRIEAAAFGRKAGQSRAGYRSTLLLVFLITMGVLVYCAQAQRVRRETAKPDSTPTSPAKGSTGDDLDKRLSKTEEKIDKLELANTRLEHNIDQAGAYSANASNTATYVITAVGIFVIVVTLIAGFGTQFVGDRQLKAALSEYQAQLEQLKETLSDEIEKAIAPLTATENVVKANQADVKARLDGMTTWAAETHKNFEDRFATNETKLVDELKALTSLKSEVEKLRDYQQKNFEPADKIKAEFHRLFEPSDKIKKDLISILLYNQNLPSDFKKILLDEQRRLDDLPPVQPGPAAPEQPPALKGHPNKTDTDG